MSKLEERFDWARKEFESISMRLANPDIRGVNRDLFYRIRNWKLSNSSRAEANDIVDKTEVAFDYASKGKIVKAVKTLTELHGIRVPMASTFLAMKFPDKFAIIDKWTIEGLGKKEWLDTYLTEPSTYLVYLREMRNRARKENKGLREYESELFEKTIESSRKK
jgi:hypothetical protein